MESPCKWYPLPNFPGLPALLVSARFGKSSYTLHVTDLANIWVEELDRRGILFRSLQENTSIDLVDADPEQWAVFLSKLRAALDPTSPDHGLTSLSIAADSQSKNQDGITLRITCELPKPLAPLKWPVHLQKCPPTSLASELVLPLVQGHYTHFREAEDLMNQLKEKDVLITKLLDKLNTMHTPLESIFNSLSAKSAATRAAAEERIKGLAPFNEEKWRLNRTIESPKDAPTLLRSVFGDSGFSGATNTDIGMSDTLNSWWAKLGSEFRAASKAESSPPRHEPREKVSISTESEAIDNEDFQVQVTPTRPTSGKSIESKAIPEVPDGGGSTVSNSHLNQPQNKPRSKIGTLGNTKTLTQHHSTSPSSRTLRIDEGDTASESEDTGKPTPPRQVRQSSARLGTIGKSRQSPLPTDVDTAGSLADETASGSDSDSGNSPKPQSPKGAPTTPRKAPLGRIGGRANDKTIPQSPGTTSDDLKSPKKTEGRKIGAIGRKPNAESKRVHPDPPAEPEEPETDEQKAERKRAELAKELNRQNAVPARKKRKF
ncbi:XLF-domain-containing protein [Nemania abortiva]|nr:XLF-domain-containing protein [Nemania abortiva]